MDSWRFGFEGYPLYPWLAVLVFVYLYLVQWRTHPLRSIPAMGGPAAPILSCMSVINFIRHGRRIVSEGYQKHHNSAFKVAQIWSWLVLVSGPKMVEELRRHSDDELSFHEAMEERFHLRHILGKHILGDDYHVSIIRDRLTRSLPLVVTQIVDEVTAAFPEHIPTSADEWTVVNVFETVQQILTRTTQRVFVGLPLCRDKKLLDITTAFVANVERGQILSLSPEFARTFFARFVNGARQDVHRLAAYIKPVLEKRRAMVAKQDHQWTDRPGDALQWILEEAVNVPNRESDFSIAERLLILSVASMNGSVWVMANALSDLATSPECIGPLREEIDDVLATHGWTKTAIDQMHKLDSFLKESSRVNALGIVHMTRKVMKDITLSDGTTLTQGTLVGAAPSAMHLDGKVYPNPDEFDPFRFARLRETEDGGAKHQFAAMSSEHIAFGHGRHGCPGRFFAAQHLKVILAYLVVNYDVRTLSNSKRPDNVTPERGVVAAGKIAFRARQIVDVRS